MRFLSNAIDPNTTQTATPKVMPAQSAYRLTESAVYKIREVKTRAQVRNTRIGTSSESKNWTVLKHIYVGPDAVETNRKSLPAYIASINDAYAANGQSVIWSPQWSFVDKSGGGDTPRGYFSGKYKVATGVRYYAWRDVLTGEDLTRDGCVTRVNGTKTVDRWPEDGEDTTGKKLVTVRAAAQRYVYPDDDTTGKTLTTFTYRAAQSGYIPSELPLTFEDTSWRTAMMSSDSHFSGDRIAYEHVNDKLSFATSSGCWLYGSGAVFALAGETSAGVAVALLGLSKDGTKLTVKAGPTVLAGMPNGRVLRVVPVSTDRIAILADLYATDGFQYAVLFVKNLHLGNPVLLTPSLLETTAGPEAERTAADMSAVGTTALWVVARDRTTGYANSFRLTAPS